MLYQKVVPLARIACILTLHIANRARRNPTFRACQLWFLPASFTDLRCRDREICNFACKAVAATTHQLRNLMHLLLVVAVGPHYTRMIVISVRIDGWSLFGVWFTPWKWAVVVHGRGSQGHVGEVTIRKTPCCT